jgi:hypothetical protein
LIPLGRPPGGMQSMSLTLVAVAKREDMIDLSYEETVGDPSPFVLTVTPQHVAHQTSKPLPLSGSDLEEFILTNVTKLKTTAENCKAQGLTSKVLL